MRLNASLGLPVAEEEDGTPIVTREDVEAVVDSWGGVYVDDKDDEKLMRLEEELRKRVVGQEEAIRALANALRRARVGLGGRTRVAASFLFVGQSGVGKTQLAKALAEVLFGSERALIRFDMSEFQEPHSISKLIGAPPGYVGYEQGAASPRPCAASPSAWSSWTRLRRPTPTSTTPSSRCWTRAASRTAWAAPWTSAGSSSS